MAGFRCVKMLLCTTVLIAAKLVTRTSAEDGENAEACSIEGEVPDSKGHCCSPDLIDAEGNERVCFKTPSAASISTACTLIGSFTFTISLYFAMNWPDEDMQRYAYQVISNTISIFSAVMMFQCLNGLVEDWIIERFELGGFWEVLVDFIHLIIWYTIMNLAIAVFSGALQSQEHRDQLLESEDDIQEVKVNVEIKCTCYGIVLAHMTGFASINVWTGLQSQAPWNSGPFMALVPLAVAIFGSLILQRITDTCRERIIMGDDKKDFFEEKWDEVCEEAENDVASLTASVLIVNALRMAINGMVEAGEGCLPNQEQKDQGEKCDELEEGGRTLRQVLALFLIGVLFAVALFLVKLVHEKFFPGEEKEEEEGEDGGEEKEEKPLLDQVVERLVDSALMTLSMAFAWCMFHATIQLMKLSSPDFLGAEENECSLAVIIGLEVTYISWIIMTILDKIEDLDDEWTPPAVDDSIEAVISGLSLLIGFAWEQCFETSVDSLAESFRPNQGIHAPAVAKFVIGSLCCTVVFLAWKWYILHFVVKEGWTYHIVMTRKDLHAAAEKLAHQDDIIKHHVLPTLRQPQYQALPGESVSELLEKNKKLLESLRKSEEEKTKLQEEKTKLQNLLSQHMKTMLTSFKSMHDADTQIEAT